MKLAVTCRGTFQIDLNALTLPPRIGRIPFASSGCRIISGRQLLADLQLSIGNLASEDCFDVYREESHAPLT